MGKPFDFDVIRACKAALDVYKAEKREIIKYSFTINAEKRIEVDGLHYNVTFYADYVPLRYISKKYYIFILCSAIVRENSNFQLKVDSVNCKEKRKRLHFI